MVLIPNRKRRLEMITWFLDLSQPKQLAYLLLTFLLALVILHLRAQAQRRWR